MQCPQSPEGPLVAEELDQQSVLDEFLVYLILRSLSVGFFLQYILRNEQGFTFKKVHRCHSAT